MAIGRCGVFSPVLLISVDTGCDVFALSLTSRETTILSCESMLHQVATVVDVLGRLYDQYRIGGVSRLVVEVTQFRALADHA